MYVFTFGKTFKQCSCSADIGFGIIVCALFGDCARTIVAVDVMGFKGVILHQVARLAYSLQLTFGICVSVLTLLFWMDAINLVDSGMKFERKVIGFKRKLSMVIVAVSLVLLDAFGSMHSFFGRVYARWLVALPTASYIFMYLLVGVLGVAVERSIVKITDRIESQSNIKKKKVDATDSKRAAEGGSATSSEKKDLRHATTPLPAADASSLKGAVIVYKGLTKKESFTIGKLYNDIQTRFNHSRQVIYIGGALKLIGIALLACDVTDVPSSNATYFGITYVGGALLVQIISMCELGLVLLTLNQSQLDKDRKAIASKIQGTIKFVGERLGSRLGSGSKSGSSRKSTVESDGEGGRVNGAPPEPPLMSTKKGRTSSNKVASSSNTD